MFLLGGVLIGLVISGRFRLQAQDRAQPIRRDSAQAKVGGAIEPAAPAHGAERSEDAPVRREPAKDEPVSVQDVLLRPFHFSFNRPTSLAHVCLHLKQRLGVPVVLDIAALGRQDVDPEDTVQLELEGVRLKTGLKLLLDQVGLTYHVVPEDNLLIITDREGSEDPLDRIRDELRSLHRDLHELRDAVDDLTDALYGDTDEGPRVRKPTIIEEKPEQEPLQPNPPGAEKKEPRAPGQKPGARPNPSTPSKPSRAPLTKPGRSL
jgi:hypothetical protein